MAFGLSVLLLLYGMQELLGVDRRLTTPAGVATAIVSIVGPIMVLGFLSARRQRHRRDQGAWPDCGWRHLKVHVYLGDCVGRQRHHRCRRGGDLAGRVASSEVGPRR